MRNIMITGGTGFIGQALVKQLSDSGQRVYVLTRNADHWKQHNNDRLHYFDELQNLPSDLHIHAVINLAGEPLDAKRWNPRQKQLLIDSRVNTTKKLAEWFRQEGKRVSVWINGSAVGWYGNQSDQIVDEQSAPVDGFSHRLCKQWEQAAAGADGFSDRMVMVRIGIVLEADGGPLAAMLLPYKFGLGGKLGSGKQIWSWIHRQDLVRLFEWLIDKESVSGPVNGTSPQPVSQAEFAKQLAQALRRPCFAHMPSTIARLSLGEFASEILLKGQKVLPAKALEGGFEFKYPDLAQTLDSILH